jgi:hypothetical protein
VNVEAPLKSARRRATPVATRPFHLTQAEIEHMQRYRALPDGERALLDHMIDNMLADEPETQAVAGGNIIPLQT